MFTASGLASYYTKASNQLLIGIWSAGLATRLASPLNGHTIILILIALAIKWPFQSIVFIIQGNYLLFMKCLYCSLQIPLFKLFWINAGVKRDPINLELWWFPQSLNDCTSLCITSKANKDRWRPTSLYIEKQGRFSKQCMFPFPAAFLVVSIYRCTSIFGMKQHLHCHLDIIL